MDLGVSGRRKGEAIHAAHHGFGRPEHGAQRKRRDDINGLAGRRRQA